MRLFLVSLGVLFAATLVAFIFARLFIEEKNAWPRDLPPLPAWLWLSTAILIISSVTMQWSLNSVRADRSESFRTGLVATLLLGMTFLLVQTRCWLLWMVAVSARWAESDEYRFALTSFYVLTGLHALHIIGGLAFITAVARRAFRESYSADSYAPVHYVTMYWHFLGIVWLVLYATMWLVL